MNPPEFVSRTPCPVHAMEDDAPDSGGMWSGLMQGRDGTPRSPASCVRSAPRSNRCGTTAPRRPEPSAGRSTTDLLPPRLQELIRLIGLPATMRFVERFGGSRIYIPAHPAEDHPFVAVIGFENLRTLSAEYGIDGIGLRFELPTGRRALNAARNERIRAEFDAGKSIRALAAEHRLVERQISRIVAEASHG
jgi:hypothetical protein